MGKQILVNFLVIVALASAHGTGQEEKFEYTKQAELAADGSIYVSSDEGKLIKMTDAAHCIEARFAADKQTVGCSVSRGSKPEEISQSLRLEINLKNGQKRIIETEMPRAAGALPYVSAVGAADKLPISPTRGGPWVKRDNIEKWCPELRVAGDYFRVFQIPFVAGRTFSNSVVPEMIISERTSEALWPKGNPIGDMLLVEGEKQPRQVVGVVKDTTALEIGDQPTPQIYFPLVDTSRSTPGAVSMQLVLRCERSCGGLLPALMERLKGAGADTFVDQAATMNDLGAVVTASCSGSIDALVIVRPARFRTGVGRSLCSGLLHVGFPRT